MELISKDKFFKYCEDIYIFNDKCMAIKDILECDFFIIDDFISNYVELLLSNLTGIPVDEIPTALMAFATLFPIEGSSWLFTNTYSNITILRFMPLQLSGVGANFRRIIYGADDKHLSYDDLGKQFKSKYTLSDLIKYNNLLVEYLFIDPKIRAKN